MSTERRIQERFSVNLQAKISFRHSKHQSQVIETVAANISSSGVFLKTRHDFPMASKVQVEFYLHLNDLKKLKFILSVETLKKLTSERIWVCAQGVVVRQAEDGIGIIFDKNYQLTPMHSPPIAP